MNMKDILSQKLDAVIDEETFIEFVSTLASDRKDEVKKEKISPTSPYSSGANGWNALR